MFWWRDQISLTQSVKLEFYSSDQKNDSNLILTRCQSIWWFANESEMTQVTSGLNLTLKNLIPLLLVFTSFLEPSGSYKRKKFREKITSLQ